ncbi:hypothetical protein F442_18502 [Phytophthora nicotianae P10297]|uniref:Uncharacterized protein n=1 Tax=Phytophthora nicotianae P10297 TaxID=1317064 RepID=W2YCV8_PHYNI|nr:hypothetical protein F442_18502 [Phytophthora nicotianae P10297]
MVRSAWNSVKWTGGRVTGQAHLGLVEDCRCVVEMARAAVAECVMSSGPSSIVAATLAAGFSGALRAVDDWKDSGRFLSNDTATSATYHSPSKLSTVSCLASLPSRMRITGSMTHTTTIPQVVNSRLGLPKLCEDVLPENLQPDSVTGPNTTAHLISIDFLVGMYLCAGYHSYLQCFAHLFLLEVAR